MKRIYDVPADDDGLRVLVDRLWPRGVKKEKAGIDYWAKDLAPTTALRKWFNHQPAKFDAFRTRYLEELKDNSEAAQVLSNMGLTAEKVSDEVLKAAGISRAG